MMQYPLSIDSVHFMFNIAGVIKRSYTHPVILMTKRDYASDIYNFLLDMRTAMQEFDLTCIIDIITKFHNDWLHAVNEIQDLKVKIKSMPRNIVFKAITFTMECADLRRKQFQKFLDETVLVITATELENLKKDICSIRDLGQSLNAILREKQEILYSFAYDDDFYNQIDYELEELSNWLDSLHDNLAMEISKLLGLDYPELLSDLTKTLQQIVNDISKETGAEAYLTNDITQIETVQYDPRLSGDNTEIGEIMHKILTLNKRLERLKNEDSIAVMALQHKKIFMEERLRSLENIKKAIVTLKNNPQRSDEDVHTKFVHESRIFDHNLPEESRIHLVEELMKLWNNALGVQEPTGVQSIISILSVSCLKEIFQDDIGKFTVDKHGRKIYKKSSDDTNLYQLNEKNELVIINDDDKHIYFYDDCGRYYKDDYNQRIYKAHASASEYAINREGLMVKVKETRDGHIFKYDNLGRFYENEEGRRIYLEEGSNVEYENDGMGNLVRIHDMEYDYQACEPIIMLNTEESKYVHDTVGLALQKCIAAVVAVLPEDPINYLASCLEKYGSNIKEREKRKQEELAMAAERTLMYTCNMAMMCNTSSKEEEHSSDEDYNFVNYKTPKLLDQ